jgi:hypothetical protein
LDKMDIGTHFVDYTAGVSSTILKDLLR